MESQQSCCISACTAVPHRVPSSQHGGEACHLLAQPYVPRVAKPPLLSDRQSGKPAALSAHNCAVQEMKAGWPKPYILGGRPPGAHWDATDKVAEYCSFESEGQVSSRCCRAAEELPPPRYHACRGYAEPQARCLDARQLAGALQGKCAWRVWELMKMYSEQGYASFMQFTPCDLWSILKGRTLWVSGDSQSQAGPHSGHTACSCRLCSGVPGVQGV